MRKLVLSSALTALVLLAGCCSHPSAEKALNRSIAANAGHMADEKLPQEARDIAQDNHDLSWQVKHVLTDEPLPADVKARMAERASADAATERDAEGGDQ